MKLYNLKNLVVVNINGKKLICQLQEEGVKEIFTGNLLSLENRSEMVPLKNKFCFSNSHQLCVLSGQQITKCYLKLNQYAEESLEDLIAMIRQALNEYSFQCQRHTVSKDKIKLDKTCATCENVTCHVPKREKMLSPSDNCLGWQNKIINGDEMTRKLINKNHNTPKTTKI